MYNLAIIDDDETFLNILKDKLTHILFDIDMDYQMQAYNGPMDFLKTVESKHYDIVLLDIDMLELDGISLAKQLRTIHHPPIIIFVTSKEKYMRNAFGLNVFSFLVKENIDTELETIVTECIQYIDNNKSIILKTDEGLQHLHLDDIICIYSEDRKIKLITIFKTFQVYQETLTSLETKINSPHFICSNRGSIVNLKYVSNTSKGCITFEYSDHIEYISRDKMKSFDKKLMEYILKQRIYK